VAVLAEPTNFRDNGSPGTSQFNWNQALIENYTCSVVCDELIQKEGSMNTRQVSVWKFWPGGNEFGRKMSAVKTCCGIGRKLEWSQ